MKRQRDDVKLLALTALNAESQKAAFAAFRDIRNRDQRKLKAQDKISYTDKILKDWLGQFSERHSRIKRYLCSDKGVELMALDGNITTKIIEHFTEMNAPILTVHDSYIVTAGYEDTLSKVMQKAVETETHVRGFAMKNDHKFQYQRLTTFQNMDPLWNYYSEKRQLFEPIKVAKGYELRLNRFNRFKEEYLSD